jgi:hypothetical protein
MLSFPVYRERHLRQSVGPSQTLEIFQSHTLILFAAAHPVSPSAATLMELRASVANKRLTPILTPLNATLTKNWGEGCSQHSDLPTYKPSNGVPALCALCPKSVSQLFCIQAVPHSFSKRGGVWGSQHQILKELLEVLARGTERCRTLAPAFQPPTC